MFGALEKYRSTACEALFCLAIATVFIPTKIYPLIFLIASLFFYFDTVKLLRHYWAYSLLIFTVYASLMFLTDLPANRTEITNFVKIPINFLWLYMAVGWLAARDNGRLLRKVDITLHIVLVLTLIQLVVYHEAANFQWLGGSPTSAHGNSIYRPSLYFWGLVDKNMFGARVALLGFGYVLLPIVSEQRVVWWRIVFVFLLAWLSLSRTPMVALFMGVLCLLWATANVRWRMVLGVLTLLAVPLVAQKIVRIDTITATNDGMGVRLVYWKTFFEHFTAISPLGNGFMSGADFLGQYAPFYHGEPHIHNTWMSCYLDFGVVGLLSYALFLYGFYRFCRGAKHNPIFWSISLLPLLAIMMILYSGYDNDIVLYLVLIFLLGSTQTVKLKQVRQHII